MWLAHLQLVALAAHGLDEYGEVQHATAIDNPLVAVLLLHHTQSQVLVELLHQAVVDMARGNKLTLLAKEGRVVDGKEHAHRRLIDSDGRQWLGILGIAYGVANLKVVQAHDSAYIARAHRIGTLASQPLEGVQLLDLGLLGRAVSVGQCDGHTFLQCTTVHAAHSHTARV